VTQLADGRVLRALRDEALLRAGGVKTAFVSRPRDEDTRKGDPDRWLDWAAGGPAMTAFYHSPHVLQTLRRLTGISWQPSGRHGSYSYYERPGQYLGLHRDVDICDLAIITCVFERRADDGSAAGMLCLYPGRTGERLSEIRRAPTRGAVYLRLDPGQSLILLGGIVPHWLVPVVVGQVRIVAPLCYRPAL
jgi:hypothetical protein